MWFSEKIDTFSDDEEFEHEENDEDEHLALHRSEPSKTNRMRDTHFTDLVPNDKLESNTPDINNQDSNNNEDSANADEGLVLFKREIHNGTPRHYRIRYSWYRNDELLDLEYEHNFQIFPNGTLKIGNSLRATGVFRCKAKGWHKKIGAVISEACHVRQTSK